MLCKCQIIVILICDYRKQFRTCKSSVLSTMGVAVHLGVKMADTLRFTAKVDMVDF